MMSPPKCLVSHSSATNCLPLAASSDRAIAIPRPDSDLVKFPHNDSEYERVAHVLSQIYNRTADTRGRDRAVSIMAKNVAHVLSPKNAMLERSNRTRAQSRPRMVPETERDILSNVGENFHTQCKNDQAEAIHRQSLQLRDKVLGRDHPDLEHRALALCYLAEQGIEVCQLGIRICQNPELLSEPTVRLEKSRTSEIFSKEPMNPGNMLPVASHEAGDNLGSLLSSAVNGVQTAATELHQKISSLHIGSRQD